jgi:glucan 1,3-beta-glucosidase
MIDRLRLALTTRFAVIVIIHSLITVGVLAYFWWNGRPVSVGAAGGRIQCLSYSPPNSDPAAAKFIPIDQIRADLAKLTNYTDCVRTYSVDNGLDQVPQVARELGLKVMLGIWIGVTAKKNEQELARALELTRTYRDVIESVVVGNEVLLRRDQTPSKLMQYIRRVREATDLPITYADVWEFWLDHPEVARDVSFITIHMLPYWEDEPVAIESAVPHIARVLARVQRAFPEHRLFIGEAGWPSMGRQRAGALPSLVNQARFFREFTRYAALHGVRYNFIEAFDQPWKRELEGTVGGAWGLFDVRSRLKFPMQGPVVNDPNWRAPLTFGVLVAVAAFVLMVWQTREHRAWPAIAVGTLAAYSGAAVSVLQWRYLLKANRYTSEWLGSVAWFGSGWIVYVCATVAIIRAMHRRGVAEPIAAAVDAFPMVVKQTSLRERFRAALPLARFVFVFGLAYIGLLLAIDPRYRDFPVMAAVLPAVSLWLHALIARSNVPHKQPVEENLLACWLVMASVWVMFSEGFQNRQAMAWCALTLLVGLTLLWSHWRSSQHESAQEQPQGRELNPI